MTTDEAFLVMNHPGVHTARTIARAADVVRDEWLRLRKENAMLRAQHTDLRKELDELGKEIDTLVGEIKAYCAAEDAVVDA